jgi:hypothetical protein
VSAEASLTSPVTETLPCPHCGAPTALDQRYCLECGERRLPIEDRPARSQFLRTLITPASAGPASTTPMTAGSRSTPGGASIIAGVGVLLLAMGVGVLIGRSGAKTSSVGPAEVVSVSAPSAGSSGAADAASTPSAAAASPGGTFSDDWPASKGGYTVQLQSLPVVGTQPSEVAAAKTAAVAKGAQGVGALRSEDFKGLPTGLYLVYSGTYASQAQAKTALPGLKRSFPAAAVIHVGGASSSTAASPSGAAASGAGTTGAGTTGGGAGGKGSAGKSGASPPSGSSTSGQSYEQKSRNLPNVVSTG